ncbi:hypothetical protein E8E14_000739 [Neopestalotiopsis sp. 37M]|nr:hypothetical protein E8E14_000739 [Neopestalotiopsis sp. 37M]
MDTFSAGAITVGSDALSQQGRQRDPKWPQAAFSHALEQLDWIFPEEIDFNDQISGMCSSTDSAMETNAHQQNLSRTPSSDLLPDNSQALAISQGSKVHTADKQECHCRVGLLSHIPELEAVMEEKSEPRVDEMFKVTSDVIRSCCSAVSCTKCYLGPVDLVCVLTVFQQTSYCFQQISQSGLGGGETKVGIGNYEILLNNDAGIKRLLVLNLVEQASVLLDALASHAESLFLAEDPPSRKELSRSPACLNQLNLDYVQEVTTRFRKLFEIIVNVFEGRGPDAGS